MALNIKDPKAHELAKALAAETGESLTHAVISALHERLDRLRRHRHTASADELLSIGRRCADGLSAGVIDHGSLLYDDQGLPRTAQRAT
jgi:antitoxin VapB